MKVTAEHLEAMREAITPFDTETTREAYRTGNFPRADAVQDLNKRYRWDLYWHAARQSPSWIVGLEGYAMDHLDTALRRIVAPL